MLNDPHHGQADIYWYRWEHRSQRQYNIVMMSQGYWRHGMDCLVTLIAVVDDFGNLYLISND